VKAISYANAFSIAGHDDIQAAEWFDAALQSSVNRLKSSILLQLLGDPSSSSAAMAPGVLLVAAVKQTI